MNSSPEAMNHLQKSRCTWAAIPALHNPERSFNLITLSFLIRKMSILMTVSQIFVELNKMTTYINKSPTSVPGKIWAQQMLASSPFSTIIWWAANLILHILWPLKGILNSIPFAKESLSTSFMEGTRVDVWCFLAPSIYSSYFWFVSNFCGWVHTTYHPLSWCCFAGVLLVTQEPDIANQSIWVLCQEWLVQKWEYYPVRASETQGVFVWAFWRISPLSS